MRHALLPLVAALLAACGGGSAPGPATLAEKAPAAGTAPPRDSLAHPAWSRNAAIYEVNVRQYTPEGTLAAFQRHLPRLQALGVDILWLMPVHPIGQKNRKGSLGSPYSVRDYYGVNPELGTKADLKAFVDAQWLSEFNARLADYHAHLAAGNGDRSDA